MTEPAPPPLDLDVVRAHFPAFDEPANRGQSFFENAGGSFACRQTIDALTSYYVATKVQPYAPYATSTAAGEAMDRSRERWGEALGVSSREVVFGPSTSMNTYVLAQAFGESGIRPGDEVLVTNQDHEANTGVFRRMAERVGARLIEWRTDPATGRLDVDEGISLITPRTRLVTVPHASNIVGEELDAGAMCRAAHDAGARVVVDGVSLAPHTFPDVAALGADVYLFSLYKTYSVHQGLMVVREGLVDDLPNQSHFFNDGDASKRLNPAGPDHAQVAAAGAVLDYVEGLDGDADGSLRSSVERVSARWRAHEDGLTELLLAALRDRDDVRLLGPTTVDIGGSRHRCPTVAFVPRAVEPLDAARRLAERGVQAGAGHFYAWRALEGMDVDPRRGVVRLSAVHYTSADDVDRALDALDDVLA
jgi:cysteine desulfurase family protein (TIGR01976 family)